MRRWQVQWRTAGTGSGSTRAQTAWARTEAPWGSPRWAPHAPGQQPVPRQAWPVWHAARCGSAEHCCQPGWERPASGHRPEGAGPGKSDVPGAPVQQSKSWKCNQTDRSLYTQKRTPTHTGLITTMLLDLFKHMNNYCITTQRKWRFPSVFWPKTWGFKQTASQYCMKVKTMVKKIGYT